MNTNIENNQESWRWAELGRAGRCTTTCTCTAVHEGQQHQQHNNTITFSQVDTIKHIQHVSDSFRKRKVLDKAETKSFDIVLQKKKFSVLKTISLSMKKLGENMRERSSRETSALHPRHHYQIPKSFWLNFELQEFVILLLKLFNLR